MFTQRHFNQLAHEIQFIPDRREAQATAEWLCSVFERDNAKFKRALWFKACSCFDPRNNRIES